MGLSFELSDDDVDLGFTWDGDGGSTPVYAEVDKYTAAFASQLTGEEYSALVDPQLFNVADDPVVQVSFESPEEMLAVATKGTIRAAVKNEQDVRSLVDRGETVAEKLGNARALRAAWPTAEKASRTIECGGMDSTAFKFEFPEVKEKSGVFFGVAGPQHQSDYGKKIVCCYDTCVAKVSNYYRKGNVMDWERLLKGANVEAIFSDVAVGEGGLIWTEALEKNYQGMLDRFDGWVCLKVSLEAEFMGDLVAVKKLKAHNMEIVLLARAGRLAKVKKKITFGSYKGLVVERNINRTIEVMEQRFDLSRLKMGFPEEWRLRRRRLWKETVGVRVEARVKKKTKFGDLVGLKEPDPDYTELCMAPDSMKTTRKGFGEEPVTLPLIMTDYLPRVKKRQGSELFWAVIRGINKARGSLFYDETFGWCASAH